MYKEIQRGSLALTVGSLAPPYVIKFDELVISFQIIIVILEKKKKRKGIRAAWRWEGAAWRNETRAWRHAMPKTPRPNTGLYITLKNQS